MAPATGSALRREDTLHASLPAFQRRVDAALVAIASAREKGRLGVSFSGGKDSTVLLDLVRRIDPEAPAAFFDSGAELQATHNIVRRYGVTVIPTRLSVLDVARYAGWWGYLQPVDTGVTFDAKALLITEPAETFVVRERLRVVAVGLRGEESGGRMQNARMRGTLYETLDGTWHCSPLAHWTHQDVWAYIASRDLPYSAAYDRMAEIGVPREEQRIGTLLGAIGASRGRHAIVKAIEPETFARLSAEFPLLGAQA